MVDVPTSKATDAAALTGGELVLVSELSSSVTITGTTISAAASDNSYNDSGSGFVTAGFAVGNYVKVVGFTGNTANNIFSAKITALTAGKMTIGGTDGDVIVDDAAGESVTITKWVSRRSTTQDVAGLAMDSAWTLAGAGQTATGVYDFAVDGAKANVDFTGLSAYNELLVIARGVTYTVSGVRIVHASVDNGSSFYSASGDYVTVSTAGVEANATGFSHSTGSTSARSLVVHIVNMKGAAKHANTGSTTADQFLFVASASDINAIRFTNSGGGNTGAGTVRVYAR